jgi:alpha-acetolactate decarboxylase
MGCFNPKECKSLNSLGFLNHIKKEQRSIKKGVQIEESHFRVRPSIEQACQLKIPENNWNGKWISTLKIDLYCSKLY